MNKTTRTLILAGIALAASALASMLIQVFTPNKSWLAFIGWMVFFVATQVPALFVTRSSERACVGWLNRFRNRQ